MYRHKITVTLATFVLAGLPHIVAADDSHIGTWQLVEPDPIGIDAKMVRNRTFHQNGLYEQSAYMPTAFGPKFETRQVGTWVRANGKIRVTYTTTFDNGQKLESHEDYVLTKDGDLYWPRLKKTFVKVEDPSAHRR